jgi:Transposase IS116/IS110/IS902 family
MIDALDGQLPRLDRQLRAYARRQTGCKALMAHYGIGELTSVAILSELGDCRRFPSSRNAVRYVGLDITVYQSDQRRSPGHLSRQGPSTLRWALYEAAVVASRAGSPDRDYYLQAAARLGHKRACLAIARKLLSAATTRCENSVTRRSSPHELIVRRAPHVNRCTAASSRQTAAATPPWTARKDRAAARTPQREPHPITIMSPAPQPTRGRGPR